MNEASRKKPSPSEMGGYTGEECLIHVYWTARMPGGGMSHHVMRGRVSADLGLVRVPDPPFTNEEMQAITFAAKMAALKCLSHRKRQKEGACSGVNHPAIATPKKPSKPQRKMLENVREGRPAHHGFPPGKSASYVLAAVLEASWLIHSMKPTGPAFVLTDEGLKAVVGSTTKKTRKGGA